MNNYYDSYKSYVHHVAGSIFIVRVCITHNHSGRRGAVCDIRQKHHKEQKKLTTVINKLPIPNTISSNERERERERIVRLIGPVFDVGEPTVTGIVRVPVKNVDESGLCLSLGDACMPDSQGA